MAGQRVSMTRTAQLSREVWKHQPQYGAATYWDYQEDLYGGTWSLYNYQYTGDRVEIYAYAADGQLDTVSTAEQGLNVRGFGGPPVVTQLEAPVLRADYVRDAMGRVTSYAEGSTYSRTNIAYDTKSQLLSDVVT